MATKVQVQKTIAVLIAAYPNMDAKTREAIGPFLQMVERLLAPYPAEVLDCLVNVRTGIMTTTSFFPSIAELKKFCEREWDKLSPRVVADRTEEIRQLYGRIEPEEIRKAQKAQEIEKRQKVIEGFKQLVSELKCSPDPFRKAEPIPLSKAEQKAAAEAWLSDRATRAALEPPPRLSGEVLEKLGY
ncbi:hypothetical protein UFOVP95_42 [uncultured Caudovirales phage]|uniref:Uncharacterized protein n=1 Tax=uncultured Caudovirales phage TaxID=2100421 RepID=A0A6J5L1W6_9CAUD|nr:hypothetical protein UFOVP95_42 [uncultured Caudovirales phage]